MSDEITGLAAPLLPDQTVVNLMEPIPIATGWLIVGAGLATEETMRIVSVSADGLTVTVERETPQPQMLATSVQPFVPYTEPVYKTLLPDGATVCSLCGASVLWQGTHSDWHAGLWRAAGGAL